MCMRVIKKASVSDWLKPCRHLIGPERVGLRLARWQQDGVDYPTRRWHLIGWQRVGIWLNGILSASDRLGTCWHLFGQRLIGQGRAHLVSMASRLPRYNQCNHISTSPFLCDWEMGICGIGCQVCVLLTPDRHQWIVIKYSVVCVAGVGVNDNLQTDRTSSESTSLRFAVFVSRSFWKDNS